MGNELLRSTAYSFEQSKLGPLAELITTIRGGKAYDPKRPTGIRSTYVHILGEERAQQVFHIEDMILKASKLQKNDLSEPPRKHINLSATHKQIGFMTPDDFQQFSMRDEGTLFYFGTGIDVMPFLYKPSKDSKNSTFRCSQISEEEKEEVSLYNQLVFYTLQEQPIMVVLAVLNKLVEKEMSNRSTIPPPPGEVPDTIRHFPKSPLMQSRDNLSDEYEMMMTVAEEFVLQQLHGSIQGYVPERLEESPRTAFYRTLGPGMFNLLLDWTQLAHIAYRGQLLEEIITSFKTVSVNKVTEWHKPDSQHIFGR